MGVKEEKQQVVQEIAEKLQGSKSTVMVDYRGLNVDEMTELRKQLREANVDFKVYKNTLTRRATAEVGVTELDDYLVGPTAIATSAEDPIAPAKVLVSYAKEHDALEIKAGMLDGELLELDRVTEIAQLPPRDGMIAMLLSVMQAPIRNFALATKAVADEKESSGDSAEE